MSLIKGISNHFFVVVGTLSGALSVIIPLQHYITLGRYQHYGIGIFLFGMGYGLHAIWTWRRQMLWPRVCYVYSALFFCSIGILFYGNPWLDWKVAIQTEERSFVRMIYLAVYLSLGIMLILIWLVAYVQTRDGKIKNR
jgi:hypothetical protein